MNFCVIFLFLNFLAGVFIFVILGIFVLTDSPFLIQMNLKTIEGKIERYDAQGKKNAYIQYFISAGLNLLYALLVWFLPKIISRRKKNQLPEKLNESDREKVGKLYLLYEGIDCYAEENHISPESCKFGNYYSVKLNDFCFEIGILIGQGTVFFFNKVPLEEDKEFIDFNDIMNFEKDRPKTLIKN